jgi:tRNA-specific 2-thiouridylase
LKTNRLIVTNDKNDPELWKKKFTVADLSWVNQAPKLPLHTGVTIRYHHPEYPALIEKIDSDIIQIKFDTPQRAITPGQAAVIYNGDELLGGGMIERVM